ncbi:hypothetical protein TRIATDRAFT_186886, partial [Trichoderma atroviride IMI 206040]
SEDKTIKILDTVTGVCLHALQGHEDYVRSMESSCDDALLASASRDYTVKMWDMNTGTCIQTLTGHHGIIWSAAFSTDNALLTSASNDYTISIWDSYGIPADNTWITWNTHNLLRLPLPFQLS